MASYRARFLQVQAANERAMSRLFADLAAGIAADVARRADADGVVPRTATFELQAQSAERVRKLYLGRNRAGELAPFDVTAEGRVIPLAPYPQALWAAISAAVRLPVEENAAILTRRLPADILDVMKRARVDPFAASKRRVVEMVGGWGLVAELEVFRPNPLANYEAPHTWVDPNGYRLSDRVWNTAAAERSRLDAYLDDAIKQGKGALAMSKELVQFLDPSRVGLKTSKPYGTKASYDAMRLARTEITRAHGQAHVVAGAMNPFVAGDKWNLSSRHPKPDICDQYARGGPNGDGVYPTGTLPGYPPHPACLCALTYAMAVDPDAIIDALRADIRRERAELVNKIGPLQVDNFDKLLLVETLPTVVAQPVPVVVAPVPVVPEQTAAAAVTALERIGRRFESELNAAKDGERLYNEATRALGGLYARRDVVLVERLTATEEQKKVLDKEARALNKQIRALNKQRDDNINATGSRLKLEQRQVAEERAVVYVRDPATNRLQLPATASASDQQTWADGMAEFNKLVSRSVWDGNTVRLVELPLGGRAFARPNSYEIHLAPTNEQWIVVHELGHVLEKRAGVLDRALAYFDSRTAGDKWEKMSVITGQKTYRDDEVAKKDKWLEPYMGKDYNRDYTEIISMGVQYMYEKPAEFAREDPGMFEFIYNLLRGR